MSNTVIIGGGAAGMMAAIQLLRNGEKVTVFEKNEKLGKKLYITGKGRCNVTNACAVEDIFANIVSNERFMYSSINAFNNYDVMGFFDELGVPLKVERGDRVFPESDKSSDILKALTDEMRRLGCNIMLNTTVKDIVLNETKVSGVVSGDGRFIGADNVIVATGGLSYPSTGSTGDGYRFAKKCGHTVSELSPALVPFNVKEDYVKELMGLSLKNVRIKIMPENKKESGNKMLYEEFGEMLFTHFGVSGPIILSASGRLAKRLKTENLRAEVDLKPALTVEQLDARILRDFAELQNKSFKNALDSLLPKKLIPVIIRLSGISAEKKINAVSKQERTRLVDLIKAFPFTVTGLRDYNEAIITQGGVCVKEINPKTMKSKLIDGLYFVGEVLDVDALTGGFNLQLAWSSAHAAAMDIVKCQS